MKEIVDNVYAIENINPAQDCIPYIIDTKSNEGLVLIDPGLYLKYNQELGEKGFSVRDINHCLITHEHLDHYGACFELKNFNRRIKFYAHELAVKKIEHKMEPKRLEESFPGYDYSTIKISNTVKDNKILTFGDYELTCIHTPGHAEGAVTYLLELDTKKILFAGDIGGPALKFHGGDIKDYLSSMQKLIDLNVDFLCDGHSGVIKNISNYIQGHMDFNKHFQIVIEEDQTNIESWYIASLKLYELDDFDFALDFCNYLLEIAPENREAHQLYEKILQHNPPEVNYIKGLLKKVSNSNKI